MMKIDARSARIPAIPPQLITGGLSDLTQLAIPIFKKSTDTLIKSFSTDARRDDGNSAFEFAHSSTHTLPCPSSVFTSGLKQHKVNKLKFLATPSSSSTSTSLKNTWY